MLQADMTEEGKGSMRIVPFPAIIVEFFLKLLDDLSLCYHIANVSTK